MISFRQKGDFSNLDNFFEKAKHAARFSKADKYGRAGVEALASATPVDTGLTSKSWYYEVKYKKDSITINFMNSNINDGVPIAIILQYGHGTKNGGWVEGRDYINPAILPVFEDLKNSAWEEVRNL